MTSVVPHTGSDPSLSPKRKPEDAVQITYSNSRIENCLAKLMDFISGLSLLGLLGMLVYSILARDVLHVPAPWLEEIATLVIVYAVAAASIGAWIRKAHIAIDIVPNLLGGVPKIILEIMVILVSLAFLGLATLGACEMVVRSANNRTTVLALSFSWYYGGLVFCFGGMMLAAVLQIGTRLFGKQRKSFVEGQSS